MNNITLTFKRTQSKLKDQSHTTITVAHARHFWSKLVGLLGKQQLAPNEGLFIDQCHSIHTIGMRIIIDVIFINTQGTVIRCMPSLAPYRFAITKNARYALELGEGGIAHLGIQIGDQLCNL